MRTGNCGTLQDRVQVHKGWLRLSLLCLHVEFFGYRRACTPFRRLHTGGARQPDEFEGAEWNGCFCIPAADKAYPCERNTAVLRRVVCYTDTPLQTPHRQFYHPPLGDVTPITRAVVLDDDVLVRKYVA